MARESLMGYEGPFVLDAERILSAMKRDKHAKWRPTSVALEERTIRQLKVVAKEHDIPYQGLMRILITYGLEAMKKARDLPWNQLLRTPLTQMMR